MYSQFAAVPVFAGAFPAGQQLCTIDRNVPNSFLTFRTTCVISRNAGVVDIGSLTVSRTSEGKIGVYIHGGKEYSDIRWIEADFTIIL